MKERVEHMGRMVTVTSSSSGVQGKTCSKCQQHKHYTDFGTRRNGEYWYLGSRCDPCKVEVTKRHRHDNPSNRIKHSVVARCNRRGTPYNLTEVDYKIPSHCPVLGIPLVLSGGTRVDRTPTMDRIDTEKGYVKGNVAIISWRANRLKNDATLTEIRRLWLYVKEHWNETH